MTLKSFLRRIALARAVNARLKCWQMKREYDALCERYGTPSIRKEPERVARRASEEWSRSKAVAARATRKLRVLFVGTDYEQDRSGILQAFRAATELYVFEQEAGRYGQRWPKTVSEFDEVRHHNARVLRDTIDRLGGVDLVVGQMWGLSMHWRTLADLRERGIAVVSIAMDDRHAWRGRRLPDGTDAGTRGIAPYLTLALTDAPECIPWYEAEGTPAMFFPEASDPVLFAPGDATKEFDVSFVGAAYGQRAQIVRAIERSGVRVRTWGTGWPTGRIPTDDVPGLFARSRIVLGSGLVGYCSDFVALKLRDFDGPMSGSLYLTHANPDFEPLLHAGSEIATFTDESDAVARVRHYLEHSDEREAIAAAGRARCVREHTWASRVEMLMGALRG